MDLAVAGGGLAGCLAALVLAARRPDLHVVIVEAGARLGGNHVWSFFDGDVAGAEWLVEPLKVAHWPAHDILFPKRRRTLGFGYNSVCSERLDAVVRERLAPERLRLGQRIAELGPDALVLESGERIEAQAVIDARGAGDTTGLDLKWQKFVGRRLRFSRPHGLQRPVIMDGTVEQIDGYRFVYCLPFDAHEMLVEDTYYSDTPALDVASLEARIGAYVAARGWSDHRLVEQEEGVLPVALGGDVDALWRASPVARLGLAGGFFHPTTGYSLPDAVQCALLLAEQQDLSSAHLRRLFHAEARASWKQRGFYRLLNRMLFRAARPEQRYRVLEHFYRLPEPVVARFYAGRSTLADKARMLTGKPPVPLLNAAKAAMGYTG